MNNTVNYRKTQWDVIFVYLIMILSSIYIGKCIASDISELFSNNNIKSEYKIELISNDSIKVYSTSNDTVYNGTIEEFHEIVHMDNL